MTAVNVHVLYATATGTAEDVSQQVAQQLVSHGVHVNSLSTIDEYALPNLPNDASHGHVFIFIVSTCADGHVPITMRKFWAFIRRSNLPSTILSQLRFTIFGLGDSAYVKFNAAARKLCTRLLDLGARLITPLALGDDSEQGGYDAQLLPWIQNVLQVLAPDSTCEEQNVTRIQVRRLDGRGERATSKWRVGEARCKPSMASCALYDSTVHQVRVLTNSEALSDDKRVIHVELDVSNCSDQSGLLSYEPGDIIHVMPRNSDSAVDAFLQLCGFDGDQLIDVNVPQRKGQFVNKFHLNVAMPCTLRQLAFTQLDLNATPRRRFFKQLAPFATSRMEREKLMHFASTEGMDDLTQYAYREKRTILLVLRDFASARPPLENLIDMIPLLRPRAFSIASSTQAHAGFIHICVSLVKYITPLRFVRRGVCSTFLNGLSKGDCVPIFLERGTSLRFNHKQAAVLIGTGTGVAPMRSYLSANLSPHARKLLLFGCRSQHGDFLYHDDFDTYLRDGRLTQLITAFSRSDARRKTYVQHRMEEHGKHLWHLIDSQQACVYVAGAAGAMPKAIRQAVVQLCERFGEWDEQRSQLYVGRMEAQGRLQMECW